MKFIHDFFNLPEVTSVDTDDGRFYTTPEGNRYESVTSFLGRFSDNGWLDGWISRVGEDKAQRVSTQAKNRGSDVHDILEQILLNNPFYMKKRMPNNLMMASAMASHLHARVSVIKGIEIGLWSHRLKLGGRADLVGEFDDVLSIIDFKTAKYLKSEDDIEGYFLQCTIYAMMVEELLGVRVPQIVVLIGVDFEEPQLFIKFKAHYEQKVLDMVSSRN